MLLAETPRATHRWRLLANCGSAAPAAVTNQRCSAIKSRSATLSLEAVRRMVGTTEGSAACMPATNSVAILLMEGLSRAQGGLPGGPSTAQRLWWHSSARSLAGRSLTGHTKAGASSPCLQQIVPVTDECAGVCTQWVA